MSTISQFTPAKLKAWIELYSGTIVGPQGPQGIQGIQGNVGNDGADGNEFATGGNVTAYSTVDTVGDIYYHNNGTVYQVTGGATFISIGIWEGTTGATGPQGPAGADGALNALPLTGGTLTGGVTQTAGDYLNTGTGTIATGVGNGSVAMTINDGQGNANLTFNHIDGVADQAGNVGRIVVNTDSTSSATMSFEIKSNGTAGAVDSGPAAMSITESGVTATTFVGALSGNATTCTTADNSLLLGGAAASDTAGNSTIVKRSSSGYIRANYFNTTANTVTAAPSKYFVETSSDGYIRKMTLANMRTNLGITKAHIDTLNVDADTLDGINSSSFVRSNATDTISGAITHSNHLTMQDSKFLYLGTGNDTRLWFNGSHTYFDIGVATTGSNLYIRDGTTTRFTFDDAGHLTATGNMTATTFNGALSGNATSATTAAACSGEAARAKGLNRSDSASDTYNLQFRWSADKSGYWSLRGYNNNTYHAHCWVGWAGTADSANALGGLAGATTGTANTVALRDASGHLSCNYLFSAYVNMNHGAGNRNADTVFYSSTDNYIRKNNKTSFKTSLFTDSDLTFAQGGGWYMADTTWVRVKANKRVYNGSTNASAFATPGDFTAGYSDMRLKTHRGKIEDALDKVCTLDGFYYERNEKAIELGYEGGELRVGLSAQQVKEVLPEVIKSAPINTDLGTDYMTLDYERIVPLLVEAIKELKEEVEELKNDASK